MKTCRTRISKVLSFGLLGLLSVSCSSSMKIMSTPVSVGGESMAEAETSIEGGTSVEAEMTQNIIEDELVMTVYASSPVGLVAPIRGAAGY